MPCCVCSSPEHTSPHCRWVNVYRDKYGKYRCSEIGFATYEAARNVGEAHGETYRLSVPVPLRENE